MPMLKGVFSRSFVLALIWTSPIFFVDAKKTSNPNKTAHAKPKPKNSKSVAAWSFLTYIQADNNLAPFALYNIKDMQKVAIPGNVNMLVQWDQPQNRKTWRFKIVRGGRIDAGSLSVEMGQNPRQELIDFVAWAKENYDATNWALNLWNHGNGVIDRNQDGQYEDRALKLLTRSLHDQWLQIPGMTSLKRSVKKYDDKGILYDDSEGTFLTNQDLRLAAASIKTTLGKNLDILGMDACLMAMLEIAYEVRNSVSYIVASQALEPGYGWSYSGFLSALVKNPNLSPRLLGNAIVKSYGDFYKRNNDPSVTLSNIEVSKLDAIIQNLDDVIEAVRTMKAIDSVRTLAMVRDARTRTMAFEVSSYVDLCNFYQQLADAAVRYVKPSIKVKGARLLSKAVRDAADTVKDAAARGMSLVRNAVAANVVGRNVVGAKGISIYFPRGAFDATYGDTQFAQDTQWSSFVAEFR